MTITLISHASSALRYLTRWVLGNSTCTSTAVTAVSTTTTKACITTSLSVVALPSAATVGMVLYAPDLYIAMTLCAISPVPITLPQAITLSRIICNLLVNGLTIGATCILRAKADMARAEYQNRYGAKAKTPKQIAAPIVCCDVNIDETNACYFNCNTDSNDAFRSNTNCSAGTGGGARVDNNCTCALVANGIVMAPRGENFNPTTDNNNNNNNNNNTNKEGGGMCYRVVNAILDRALQGTLALNVIMWETLYVVHRFSEQLRPLRGPTKFIL